MIRIPRAAVLAGTMVTSVVVSCASQPPAPATTAAPGDISSHAPDPAFPVSARFDCDGLIVPVVVYADRIVLSLPNRDRTLAQVVSASGARYSDGDGMFWDRGGEAALETDGRLRTCRALPDPWQDARERGLQFRAVGQEPGWFLEIDEARSIHLIYDYGEREATMPAPAPLISPEGTTYEVPTGPHRPTIEIAPRRCHDC